MARWCRLNEETFRKQYKFHLSGYTEWDQLSHCEDWLLFPENLGSALSMDETSLRNGELYTVVSNKAAKGLKGSLVALVKGTKAADVTAVLMRIPMKERVRALEVTLDMDDSMDWISRECFPNAKKTVDRFHAQKLVSEALQEMRIRERWAAIEEENKAMQQARKMKLIHRSPAYSNGDTKKQLLARSRYLLFKPQSKWTDSQKERASILFKEFSELERGYGLSMMFRSVYEHSETREEAQKKLGEWYTKTGESGFRPLLTAMGSIRNHEGRILNYFPDRSTNASAESFNAKLKGFRSLVRGVTDLGFFLFRITKIYG